MPAKRLDPVLLDKIAVKIEKDPKYVREQTSRRASRLNIASEAALVLWAKEFGIGTAAFQRKLAPHIQQQIVSTATAPARAVNGESRGPVTKGAGTVRGPSPLRGAIELLLSDEELRRRCGDLLTARKSFDRAFREATVVLDQRLKRLGRITGKINPAELVARTLHPDKAILIVSEHRDEQQGVFELVKGIMAVFRNPTHHSLNDQLTREDALRFCGFIDSVLSILGRSVMNPPGSPTA